MSTGMSQQQPPKEDEEEDDEEQGEEFSFEDSADEEKLQEGRTGVTSDSLGAVQLSKKEDRETPGSVSQTGADCTQLLRTSPPAGQEGILTGDEAPICTADVPVNESPSGASEAEPSTSAPRVGEELQKLPVVPPAVEMATNSGNHGEEIVKESSDAKDTSEVPRAAQAEPQTAEAPEVIYDDVPSEGPRTPDEDMIYEDVQRDSGPPDADNGWSSSEFESYDEQSDNDTKHPARSKVVSAKCVCVYLTQITASLYSA